MRDSDESLLKSYALNRDEVAFRLLAERYLGLIFHTALRRTNNRPLAEEVSQNILCALAKKAAALAENPDLLPAWLHRATLYESSKAMRSESSYQRRKQLQASGDSAGTCSNWIEALPHLDQALDKLPEPDRHVLLQHFFESHPFPKIAQALGKSPAAVQKQSQRAIEKLSRILRSKGVTLSATVLATGLISELAKAAPASLLKTATTAVLTGTATYSTTGLTLMFATKSKALIPVVILLCAAPLALQQIAISNVKRQNDALRSKLSLADSPTSEFTPRRNVTAARGSGISTNLDIMVLVEDCDEAQRLNALRRDAFAVKLSALPPETLVKLIGEGAALRIQLDKKSALLRALVTALAETDTEVALSTAIANFEAGPEFANLISRTDLGRHFSTWAYTDPAAAFAWFKTQEASTKFEPLADRQLWDSNIYTFKIPLVGMLVSTKSPLLSEFLSSLRQEERSYLIHQALGDRYGKRTADELAVWLASFVSVIREYLPENDRDLAFQSIGRSFQMHFAALPSASIFLTHADLESDEREIFARQIACSTLAVGHSPPDPKLDARIDADVKAWLEKELPGKADEVMSEARERAAKGRFQQAKQRIEDLQRRNDITDRDLADALTKDDLKSHLPEALKLAERIKDPQTRASTAEWLNQQ